MLEGRRRQFAQHRQPRSQGHRVAGEGAALADAAPGRRVVAVHDVGAPAERAHREAAADDLPERGQIGRDAVMLLRAAARQPEADDLVEDHQHPVPGGDLAHAADEVRGQVQDSALRIQHDARQLLGVLGDQPLGRLQVAERQHHRVGHRPGRHADRLRVGQRPLGRAGLLQRGRDRDLHRVVAAVVAALELGDQVPAREGARQAHRVQAGLGPGVGEARPFQAGHAAAQLRAHLGLVPHGRAQGDAALQLRLHRRHHGRVVVAQDLAGVVVGEVGVPVAVDVEQVRAVAALHGQRVGAVEVGALGDAAGRGVGVGREVLQGAWCGGEEARLELIRGFHGVSPGPTIPAGDAAPRRCAPRTMALPSSPCRT